MPRYFFDIHDGDHFTPDYVGIELASIQAAKNEAKKALPDIVKDELPDGDRRNFVVVVKDEVGHEIVRVTLSLVVESLSQA
jgi:branched-subunit amino acid aminotransferase/4-amino-4-deoxychorismate lyase